MFYQQILQVVVVHSISFSWGWCEQKPTLAVSDSTNLEWFLQAESQKYHKYFIQYVDIS